MTDSKGVSDPDRKRLSYPPYAEACETGRNEKESEKDDRVCSFDRESRNG